MTRARFAVGLAVLGVAVTAAAACRDGMRPTQTITMAEVDKAAANQLTKIRQQEYDVRKAVLQQLVNEKLIAQEAAARKVTPEELIKQEVEAKAPAATDADAQAYYDRMKGRMAGTSSA